MPHDPLEEIRSFLVPIDGGQASDHALAVVCGIARRTHAQVAVLHVIEVPRSLSLDAELQFELERGERIVGNAELLAGRHDVKVQCQILQARNAGAAMVEEAAAVGAGAIVLGLDYHRPYGRFEVSPVPMYVLENAACQVWLMRYPPAAEEHG